MNSSIPFKTLLFTIGLTLSPLVQAQYEENEISYDALVSELKNTTTTRLPDTESGDPFAQILFHGGVAYSTSYLVISPEQGGSLSGLLRGVEFTFGIDLLSRNWLAEGAVRSYQPENLNKATQVSLREFDLKLVYNDEMSRNLRYRVGGGLTSRYLTFNRRDADRVLKDRYTTPSSVVFVGAQVKLGPKLSIGPDLSYRSSLVDETVDKKSFDANVRLSAHF
jgi:hypothetical protein